MSAETTKQSKDKPILTVIMPVYNTDKYLEECMDSLVNQTLKEIEIICVNDASTDRSYEILKEYAEKDDRIKIINQETNVGQSICRNTALEHINGEYTVFIDSDDKIELDGYEKVLKFAQKYQNDVVIFDTVRFNHLGSVWPSILHSRSITGETVTKTNILEHKELVYDTGPWNKFIKSDFLLGTNIKFLERSLYQDLLFSMELFTATDNIGIYPDVKYYWRVRGGSVTNKIDFVRNISNRVNITNKIIEVFNREEKYKVLIKELYIKLAEIDFLQFMNNIDTGNEEYRRIVVEEFTPKVREFPQEAFDILEDIDKLKYELLLEDKIDELIALVHHDNLFKANQKELKNQNKKLKSAQDKNKKLSDDNKKLKDKNNELKEDNKKLKEKNKELKKKNKKMKNEMRDVKSTKGWFKYKTNNIYDRTINKRSK